MTTTPGNGAERISRAGEPPSGNPDSRHRRARDAPWVVPEPLATAEIRMADGTPTTLRRYGNPNGRRIITSHGNGFAADAYYPFWLLFLDRFDVVVYDYRNHGWNPVGDRKVHNVPTFIRDKASVVSGAASNFGEKAAIGVFHSLSARNCSPRGLARQV